MSGCTALTLTSATPQESARAVGERRLLKNAQMEPDAAVLEIFFVRRSMGDASINVDAWREAVDLQIPSDLRFQLKQNGLRFGQVSRQIPTELAQLLKGASDSPKPGADNASARKSASGAASRESADSSNPVKAAETGLADNLENEIQIDSSSNLAKEESVVCRHLEISPHKPCEILASEIYDEVTVLIHHDGGLGGQTYRQAQCVFELKSELEPSGGVRLTLLPEIQYGQSRQQFSVQQGVVKLEYGRNREIINQLKTSVSLKPGEIIILSCDSDLTSSLGSCFFSDASNKGLYQKLLVIRLVQTQHDGLFPSDGEKPLDTAPAAR